MAENRKLAPTTLLILLAVASFAAAAVTITNITEWHVQSAGTPPIVKVVGNDAVYGNDLGGKLANVTIKAETDGTNRTIITIRGYTGDPTKYDEVIKICNKDTSKSYAVELVYNGVLSGDWTYVKYLRLWLGTTGPLEIKYGVSTGTFIGPVTVGPNSCVSVPAEVLVTPDAPTGSDLISIRVDVVSTTSP
jgi:hypothetical protein